VLGGTQPRPRHAHNPEMLRSKVTNGRKVTQGKIERWRQTLKNRILLENYYVPGDLVTQIAAFVADSPAGFSMAASFDPE
jgi:hypothetical protein